MSATARSTAGYAVHRRSDHCLNTPRLPGTLLKMLMVLAVEKTATKWMKFNSSAGPSRTYSTAAAAV